MAVKGRATVADLYRIPENGKAELINGEIVRMSPTGRLPGRASGEIYISLRGEVADVEPAVPSWTMPVDDLFA